MAQSSAGIKLFYTTGALGGTSSAPTLPQTPAWVEIPDVTSIPALGGEPNMLDVTTLAETEQKRYIAGLKDGGGSMAYNVLMTQAMLTATDAASTVTSGKTRIFLLEFPAPLNKTYWYKGMGVKVLPGETEVDGVLSSTFYTSVESTPTVVSAG